MAYIGEQNQGHFNNKIISERSPVIELSAIHPLSDLRDEQQVISGGTVTDLSNEYKLSHFTAGDLAKLTSSSRGRHLPDNTSEIGVGIRLDQPVLSGDVTAYWGYFEMDTEADNRTTTKEIKNGLLFGQDSGGTFVELITSGKSEHKQYKGSWNINNDIEIDTTKGDIYQITFNYGYGLIVFEKIISTDGDTVQEVIPLHSFKPNDQTKSLPNSNLHVGGLIKSDTTDQNLNMFIAGRKFIVMGQYDPQKRITTQSFENITIGTSDTFIGSFRKKGDRRFVSLEIYGVEGLSDQDILVETRFNMDVSGVTYNTIDNQQDSETSLEHATSATDFDRTTGVKLFETLIPSSGGGNSGTNIGSTTELPFDMGDEGVVSIIGRALGTEATSTLLINFKEEY